MEVVVDLSWTPFLVNVVQTGPTRNAVCRHFAQPCERMFILSNVIRQDDFVEYAPMMVMIGYADGLPEVLVIDIYGTASFTPALANMCVGLYNHCYAGDYYNGDLKQ